MIVNKYVLLVYIYFYVNFGQKIKDFSQMRRSFVHNTQKKVSCRERQAEEGFSCGVTS